MTTGVHTVRNNTLIFPWNKLMIWSIEECEMHCISYGPPAPNVTMVVGWYVVWHEYFISNITVKMRLAREDLEGLSIAKTMILLFKNNGIPAFIIYCSQYCRQKIIHLQNHRCYIFRGISKVWYTVMNIHFLWLSAASSDKIEKKYISSECPCHVSSTRK